MKRTLIAAAVLFLIFTSCKNGDAPSGGEPENDVDAARTFIRDALDGHYSEARRLLVPDSLNSGLLDAFANNYQARMSGEEKRGYRESSINMHQVKQLNDSTTIVDYSNTFKNERDSLKVVRLNGKWMVDLKYSFPPSSGSPGNQNHP